MIDNPDMSPIRDNNTDKIVGLKKDTGLMNEKPSSEMSSEESDEDDESDEENPKRKISIRWRDVLWRMILRAFDRQTTLYAAGCAFFATLALFPSMSALVSIYGLVFDLKSVEPQLNIMQKLLPADAYAFIVDSVHHLIMRSHSSLTAGLVLSLVVAIWSAAATSRSILVALNMVYSLREMRGVVYFQIISFLITVMGIIGVCLTVALMVAAPTIIDDLPAIITKIGVDIPHTSAVIKFFLDRGTPVLIHWLAPSIMILFVMTALSLLYRIGPCREWTLWRWIFPGVIVSTFMWIVVSFGFSWYVSNFASYGRTYGPLGAVAAIMMWMFISFYIIMIGAYLNCSLEERGRFLIEEEGIMVPPMNKLTPEDQAIL